MSLRRSLVALAVLVSGALGGGVVTPANASPPCDQAASVCQTVDTARRTGAAFFTLTYSACDSNVPVAAVCPAAETAGYYVYYAVFAPWFWVCWYNEPEIGTGCIGPIE